MRFRLPVLFATSLLLLTAHATADVLLLDAINQANAQSQESRPARGMSMDQVKADYGEPTVAHPWVGDPPITRWDYPDYSVFFEYQHVLTSVLHQR